MQPATRIARPGLAAASARVTAGVLTAVLSAAMPAAAGLEDLARVVHRACECAARQASGMDAAIRCTHGPREFGRVKVQHRDGWNDAQRGQMAELERIIETCISGAMDADAARAQLGLPPAQSAEPTPLVRWREIAAVDLGAHPSRLVRIARTHGAPVKGLVEAVAHGEVVLRQARRDGGSDVRIPLGAIQGAWVMEY